MLQTVERKVMNSRQDAVTNTEKAIRQQHQNKSISFYLNLKDLGTTAIQTYHSLSCPNYNI
jgi:hypothetical protein